MRKFLFITLSIIFAFITLGQAGEIYKCTDRHGNLFITSSPRDGMKCDLRESFEESASKGGAEEEKAVTKNDKSAAALEKERLARINKCYSCCTAKQQPCYNYTADNRLCAAEFANCNAMCKSEGASSSAWSDCWSESAQ
ncbi:MAG: hypothetical protein BWX99_02810 [Deltaproteobacteria bacterium ADurb.Bin151]|nr:DUF4124 domain-containing protein [Smithella sp.]OQB51137.1 MAG: hypothetical protein BWX99_02810 [Deltaproteobacteria bacterium ADurb.Bin151]HOQ41720.1 DUF4124 domain-containing protein [Smithellaceae bacterium]HPL65289.1 DUF4124 domain-containing protein [Smithellaceae bacterium]